MNRKSLHILHQISSIHRHIYSQMDNSSIHSNSSLTIACDTSNMEKTTSLSTATSSDKAIVPSCKDTETQSSEEEGCSWQRTAGLLLSEYICLGILSLPLSFSILGLVPGILITITLGILCYYTGTVVGNYCVAHPTLRDVCDIGRHIFWGKQWAYYATMTCFLLSTFFVQGMHVLVGAVYFNAVTDDEYCTVSFAALTAVICLLIALPRGMDKMSEIGLFAAFTQFVAVVLCTSFIGTQEHPAHYDPNVPVTWSLWPRQDITFPDAMNAIMNIVFMFTGHICYPHFIAEMKRPQDFHKALKVLVVSQLCIFVTIGAVILNYVGDDYVTSLAYGALADKLLKIISLSFSLPTIIFLGSLFGNISTSFIFVRLLKGEENKEHREGNTTKGWLWWIGISVTTWIIGFSITELIPFFSELLALISALFQGWFSFVFWGIAFLRLKQQKYNTTSTRKLWRMMTFGEKWLCAVNSLVILVGLLFFGPGTYAAIVSIIVEFQKGKVGGVFSCDSTSL